MEKQKPLSFLSFFQEKERKEEGGDDTSVLSLSSP
jgi:hypothetical protein